ncbi:pyridoxal phosphate-dependent transferase [Dactylonectria macrodidyma]|uniref:Pyridoxal phosphate-dependent transferase n=1 Tax=Dactylonectria macrodidyma TaxID=307937 RepID=A0A9P9IUS8_9HYPO|nr:pyridoxal phosphate-dependent transferase [Dactylonectria macrodidyma]
MALKPSRRGLRNLSSNHEVNYDNDLRGVTYYDPISNPHGLIDISGASNELTRDILKDYSEQYSKIFSLSDAQPPQALTYGGVTGPPELNQAMSTFFNDWFKPARLVQESHIITTNGVSGLIDMLAFNVCDHGDGILLPSPNYSMLERDLGARAGVAIIPVHTRSVEDQFSADRSSDFIHVLEAAYHDAARRGIRAKAVFLTNPSNPVGRFYSEKTLLEVAKLCGRLSLHLIADEIYALSGFDVNGPGHLPGFTSVLSIADSSKDGVYSENIHSLYGVSKDWGMGGLRLGFLVSLDLLMLTFPSGLFTWVTHFSTQFWLDFVSNEEVVSRYVQCNRDRLRERYQAVTALMDRHGVPYVPSNGGIFIYVDLRRWLKYFDGPDGTSNGGDTRETQLCRYLIRHGIYMTNGELCFSSIPGYFRFVYTSPNDEAFVAVQRIRDAFHVNGE